MSSAVARRRRHVALRAAVIGLIWSLGLVLAALLLPTTNGETFSPTVGVTFTRLTLVQSHGAWVVVLILVPLVVSLLCLAVLLVPSEQVVEVTAGDATFSVNTPRESARRLRAAAWVAVVVLWLVSLAGILSVGAYLVPAALMLTVALALVAPHHRRSGREVATEA